MFAINYGDQKLAEKIRLEQRQRRLIFQPWHDPIRFVNDFEKIINDYEAVGTTFEDESLIGKFLAMIDIETGGAENQYVVFCNIMQALLKEFRTFELIKTRFLNYTPKIKPKKPEVDKSIRKPDYHQKPLKRASEVQHGSAPSKNKRKSVYDLVNRKSKVTLEDLYSLEQRTRLPTMTNAEKAENRCSTCNIYFHQADKCPYKQKFCMNCFHFGHSQNECKQERRTKKK